MKKIRAQNQAEINKLFKIDKIKKKEFLYRIWFRQQIFCRILLKLKNSQVFYNNYKISKKWIMDFKKSNKISIVFPFFLSKLMFRNLPSEVFQVFNLIYFFFFIISKQKLKFYCFDNSYFFKKKKFLSINSVIMPKKKKSDNLTLKKIGKIRKLDGIICYLEENNNNIAGILLECCFCSSNFFFMFESFIFGTPILCINIHCSSKNFFYHQTRIVPSFIQKIKIVGKVVSIKKFNETLRIEITRYRPLYFYIGDLVTIQGTLKIFDFPINTQGFFLEKNIYGFYLNASIIVSTFHSCFLGNKSYFLSPDEYILLNTLSRQRSLFKILINTLNDLPGHYGLKGGIILLASRKIVKTNDFFICTCYVICNKKNPQQNQFSKILKNFPGCFRLNSSIFSSQNFPDSISKNEKNFLSSGKKIVFLEDLIHLKNELRFVSQIFAERKKSLQNDIFVIFKTNTENNSILKSLEIINEKRNFIKMDFRPILLFHINEKYTNDFEKEKSFRTIKNFKIKKFKATLKKFYKNSKFKKEFFKNIFSKIFFFRFYQFLENFPIPTLKENSFLILYKIYDIFREVNNKYKETLNTRHLLILLKMGESRAKIDLKKFIEDDDIFDCLEIFCDSRLYFRKNFKTINIRPELIKYFNIQKLYHFIKMLKKYVFINKQTIFDIIEISKKSNRKIKKKDCVKIIKTLANLGFLEILGKRFFRINKYIK